MNVVQQQGDKRCPSAAAQTIPVYSDILIRTQFEKLFNK
jgi:hypothetical protein